MYQKLRNINYVSVVTGLIVIIGIVLRSNVYFANNSFWLDELLLAENMLNNDFYACFKKLEAGQIAPPIFCVISKAIFNIFQPTHNMELCDLAMRFLPFISSIVSLAIFPMIVSKIFKNDCMTLMCTTLFSINVSSIMYSSIFKQYSIELLVSEVLLLMFLSFNIKTVSIKKLVVVSGLCCLVPWLSFSSYFILICGFLFVLIDIIKNKYFDKTKFAILLIPSIVSFSLFIPYFLSIQKAYGSLMRDYWLNFIPSFFTFQDFFKMFDYKLQTLMEYPLEQFLILFLIFNTAIMLFQHLKYKKEDKYISTCICFILLPIVLLITCSFLKLYPFERRLMLFLLPMFVILYSQFILLFKNNKFTKTLFIVIALCVGISNLLGDKQKFFVPDQYARDIVKHIVENNNENTKIICSPSPLTYYFKILEIDNFIPFPSLSIGSLFFTEESFINIFNVLPSNGEYCIYNYFPWCQVETAVSEVKHFIFNNKNIKILNLYNYSYEGTLFMIKFKKN